MRHLKRVAERLAAFDAPGALDEALREWAIAPAAELENLVVELARVARNPIDPLAQTREKPHQAWLTVAARKNPAELSWLIEAFVVNPFKLYSGPRKVPSLEKLTALTQFAPDPRLANLAAAQLRSGSFRAKDVVARLSQLLISAKHPRARTVLESRELDASLITEAEDRKLGPCSLEGLPALISLNEAKPAQSTESLFEAVYRDLDNDGARQVLADALIEVDDVRGEYIALAFNPKKTGAAKKLLEKIRGGWLAPWRDFIAIDMVEFERGLPVSALFIDAPTLDPSMRSLRSIAITCDDASFAFAPELLGVRSVEARATVLAKAPATQVEWSSLKLSSGDDASGAKLFGRMGTMPKLESLVLDGVGPASVARAVTWLETFAGHLELALTDAASAGHLVTAVMASSATLSFVCREASLRGTAKRGALSLRVASMTPTAKQRAFVDALPARFESLDFELTELDAAPGLPAPFDSLKARAAQVNIVS